MAKNTGTAERNVRVFLSLYNECVRRKISDSTMDMITVIKREATTQGGIEQRSRVIGRITDILQESKTEEEFLQKLKTEFPEAF